jgi:hypothetical protein
VSAGVGALLGMNSNGRMTSLIYTKYHHTECWPNSNQSRLIFVRQVHSQRQCLRWS